MKSMNVDPERWGWFKRDYSGYSVSTAPIPAYKQAPPPPQPSPAAPVRQDRAFRPWLLIIGLGIAALYLFAIGVLMAVIEGTAEDIQIGVITTGVAILAATLCCVPKIPVRVLGFAVTSAFLLIGLNSLGVGSAIAGAYFLAAPTLSFIPAAFISKSFPRRNRKVRAPNNKAVAPHQPMQRFYPAPGVVYGKPGSVGNATDVFSKEALEAGVAGEKNTAVLLPLLMKIPGTSIFHGLYFPGSKVADVDHAVSHGNTVYLIDSKMYRGSTYEWGHDGENDLVVGPGVQSKKNSMAAAANGYRSILGYGVKVIPIVIVHGKNVRIGTHRWSRSGVGLFTPHEAMDYIGTELAGSMPTWSDRPQVRSDLVSNLKPFA